MNLSSLQKLGTLGLSTEQMAGVIDVLAAELAPCERSRELAAERQSRYLQRHGNVRMPLPSKRHSDVDMTSSRVEDNTLPSLTSGKEVKEESKTSLTVSSASKPLPSSDPDGFGNFWVFYPKRDGSADRKGAVKAFNAALRRTDLKTIMDGVEAFGLAMAERGKVGTEFIPQARTWLNGDRWNERYSAPSANAKPNGIQDGFAKVRAVIDEIERRETPGNGTASSEDDVGLSRL